MSGSVDRRRGPWRPVPTARCRWRQRVAVGVGLELPWRRRGADPNRLAGRLPSTISSRFVLVGDLLCHQSACNQQRAFPGFAESEEQEP